MRVNSGRHRSRARKGRLGANVASLLKQHRSHAHAIGEEGHDREFSFPDFMIRSLRLFDVCWSSWPGDIADMADCNSLQKKGSRRAATLVALARTSSWLPRSSETSNGAALHHKRVDKHVEVSKITLEQDSNGKETITGRAHRSPSAWESQQQ